MTREEHLTWAKQRAHEYLAHGDLAGAVASMMSDMNKHPECKVNSFLGMSGLLEVSNGNTDGVRRFIDGFR